MFYKIVKNVLEYLNFKSTEGTKMGKVTSSKTTGGNTGSKSYSGSKGITAKGVMPPAAPKKNMPLPKPGKKK